MDMPLLNTLVYLEDTLLRLLHRINETRAQQHQLAHDPGLIAWQAAVTQNQPGPLALLPPLDPALSGVTPQDWCRDCGVREGMLHEEGCPKEVCPNCTHTVEHCECLFAPGALGHPRVPFFAEPPYCCYRCKVSIPPMFRVPNMVWQT
jgi:hypothetical protein